MQSEHVKLTIHYLLFLADNELRTIIDKLANFVARNGPDFEHMTKMKQKGNPKFNFLFGGEYYNYYSYKVATETQSKFRFMGVLHPRPML